ncbi:hypothetical protein VSR69_39605 [Paraburkholderia phytofirmans]
MESFQRAALTRFDENRFLQLVLSGQQARCPSRRAVITRRASLSMKLTAKVPSSSGRPVQFKLDLQETRLTRARARRSLSVPATQDDGVIGKISIRAATERRDDHDLPIQGQEKDGLF